VADGYPDFQPGNLWNQPFVHAPGKYIEKDTTEHIIQLTGLRPDTRYFYAVGNGQQISAKWIHALFYHSPNPFE
jgi:hypothetical protein